MFVGQVGQFCLRRAKGFGGRIEFINQGSLFGFQCIFRGFQPRYFLFMCFDYRFLFFDRLGQVNGRAGSQKYREPCKND